MNTRRKVDAPSAQYYERMPWLPSRGGGGDFREIWGCRTSLDNWRAVRIGIAGVKSAGAGAEPTPTCCQNSALESMTGPIWRTHPNCNAGGRQGPVLCKHIAEQSLTLIRIKVTGRWRSSERSTSWPVVD